MAFQFDRYECFDNFEQFGAKGNKRYYDVNKDFESGLDDEDFRKRYRVTKQTFNFLVHLFEQQLEKTSNRNHPLKSNEQLLLALRFYATGSFQMLESDLYGVHQTTVCRCVHRVSKLIASLAPLYIKFPTEAEFEKLKTKFFNMHGFPGVIGLIDGTHVQIEKPSNSSSELYRNRKGVFSINVQIMMDCDFNIRDIVCRWYGSAHDSRIFNNSRLKERMEQLQEGMWLLGDSGYPCLPYLLTPYLSPSNRSQEAFNVSHKSTRNLIERGFGIWKRRFPAIKYVLRTKLYNCPSIIVACAVLHNICILQCDQFFIDELEVDDLGEIPVYQFGNVVGNAVRNMISDRFFA